MARTCAASCRSVVIDNDGSILATLAPLLLLLLLHVGKLDVEHHKFVAVEVQLLELILKLWVLAADVQREDILGRGVLISVPDGLDRVSL